MTLIYDPDVAMGVVSATIILVKGGVQQVQCSRIDFDKLDGVLAHPFLDNNWNWQLFVIEDPNGNPTGWERANGKITNGKSFFHYLSMDYYHKYHLKDNEWTNLTRQNWEPRPSLSRAERRIQRAIAAQKVPLELLIPHGTDSRRSLEFP